MFSCGFNWGHLAGSGTDGDVVGHDEPGRQVPPGLIDEQHRPCLGQIAPKV